MNELYHSGSILVLFFSGVSGSAILTNDIDHLPIDFKDNKGYIYLNKTISKNELINNYIFLKTDDYYITKYKMINTSNL